MSVYRIQIRDGKKVMLPVHSREEYMAIRDSEENRRLTLTLSQGEGTSDMKSRVKGKFVQMNYSCMPNEDGTLKGSKRMTNSVGMDIDLNEQDFASEKETHAIRDRILGKKDELGLLMLEESATKGYHLVFRRHPEMSQEENLKWASALLGVAYDKGAKDITRVFYTPADKLIYLDDEIFKIESAVSATYTSVGHEPCVFNGDKSKSAVSAADFHTGEQRYEIMPPLQGSDNGDDGKDRVDTLSCSMSPVPGSQAEISASDKPSVTALQCDSSKCNSMPPLQGSENGDNLKGSADALPSSMPSLQDSQTDSGNQTSTSPVGEGPEASYHDILFSDIIAKYWELYYDGKEPCEGDRNVKTYELAMTLRPICDYSVERMMQVIPQYDGFPFEEYKQTLENAAKEPRKGMPYRLRQVLLALKRESGIKATGGTWNAPPKLPKRLPPLIKLLTKNVPWYYKAAVASQVFAALTTHIHGVKFRYWDNVDWEPKFQQILIARQSAGKGCIKTPIEYILKDIQARDIPNRQREAEWKLKNPSGKTKAKDPRPEGLIIQILIDNLTDAVFNQRNTDASSNGGYYLYLCVDEIEALKKITSKGTIDEVSLMIRKAHDNAIHGQERVGSDSVTGIAPLRLCWNASTTPPNARRFLAKAVNDGTLGRLDLATIIFENNEDEDEDPIYGIYDEKYYEELKPYLDRLDAANGLIECPQAKKLALKMKAEDKDRWHLYDSDGYKVLSFRANLIAWMKGMVLYIAHGYRWSKDIENFVRWAEQYNMWCKMTYFGQQLEQEMKSERDIQRSSGPVNLLDLLEDEFTLEAYRQMRFQQGKDGDGKGTLRQWKSRGYIEWDEIQECYRKTESYRSRCKV